MNSENAVETNTICPASSPSGPMLLAMIKLEIDIGADTRMKMAPSSAAEKQPSATASARTAAGKRISLMTTATAMGSLLRRILGNRICAPNRIRPKADAMPPISEMVSVTTSGSGIRNRANGTATSVPQWLGWLSGDSVLALYEDRAVLYGANGGEKASYDFGGSTLVDVDTENGGVALLLSGGQTCTAVLLDNSLGVQYSGNVPAANHILRAADGFYLLTDSTVECFNKAGEFQWTQPMDAKPQAGVLNGRQLLVFSGNTVQQVTAPEPDSSSAS